MKLNIRSIISFISITYAFGSIRNDTTDLPQHATQHATHMFDLFDSLNGKVHHLLMEATKFPVLSEGTGVKKIEQN